MKYPLNGFVDGVFEKRPNVARFCVYLATYHYFYCLVTVLVLCTHCQG